MPFIDIKITMSISSDQREAIKLQLGQAISLLSGKTEDYLMIGIQDDYHLYLSGYEMERGAAVTVQHYGDAKTEDLEKLGKEILNTLEAVTAIPSDSVYIIFQPGVETWTLFGDTYHTDIYQKK